MSFSIFEVLLIIGITQGFVVSLMIWFGKAKAPDKILLSILLTVFNFLCFKIILLSSGLWQHQWFRYFPLPFDLAVQPLIFLYVSSLTSPGFSIKKKTLLHRKKILQKVPGGSANLTGNPKIWISSSAVILYKMLSRPEGGSVPV
jgi:hypothetical protein